MPAGGLRRDHNFPTRDHRGHPKSLLQDDPQTHRNRRLPSSTATYGPKSAGKGPGWYPGTSGALDPSLWGLRGPSARIPGPPSLFRRPSLARLVVTPVFLLVYHGPTPQADSVAVMRETGTLAPDTVLVFGIPGFTDHLPSARSMAARIFCSIKSKRHFQLISSVLGK